MKTEYKLILKKNLDVILEDTIEIEDASEIYDTPAEALLAAYIAAVWAEEMR